MKIKSAFLASAPEDREVGGGGETNIQEVRQLAFPSMQKILNYIKKNRTLPLGALKICRTTTLAATVAMLPPTKYAKKNPNENQMCQFVIFTVSRSLRFFLFAQITTEVTTIEMEVEVGPGEDAAAAAAELISQLVTSSKPTGQTLVEETDLVLLQ